MKKTKMIAAVAALTLAGGCATPGERSQASIPEKLKAPAGETLSFETLATGVQIYECGASKEAGRFEWVFKGPEADLFDRSGNRVGKHYGGPTWESNDGSKVVAAVQARENAPDARAIPWLLLEAKSTSGDGVFGRTKRIQRVHTVGGITPAETCGQAEAGKTTRVAYQATYYFYVPRQ